MQTIICKHQEHGIAVAVAEGKMLGEMVGLKQEEAEAAQITSMIPTDATPEQTAKHFSQIAKMFFFASGVKCESCGHTASGPLTQPTDDEIKRWEKDCDDSFES